MIVIHAHPCSSMLIHASNHHCVHWYNKHTELHMWIFVTKARWLYIISPCRHIAVPVRVYLSLLLSLYHIYISLSLSLRVCIAMHLCIYMYMTYIMCIAYVSTSLRICISTSLSTHLCFLHTNLYCQLHDLCTLMDIQWQWRELHASLDKHS